MGMKIINSNGNTCLLKMTQEEWQDIGAKQNWVEPKQKKTKVKDTVLSPEAPIVDDSKPDVGNDNGARRLHFRPDDNYTSAWARDI